jgi:5-methylcytosine-specific restriction endonuclease McrA
VSAPILIECSPETCGQLFCRCGKYSTYTRYACRCATCKTAASDYARTRREANPELIQERDRRNRANNSAKINAKRREHYAANRGKFLAKKHERWVANTEFRKRSAERARKRREANPEYSKEKAREFREANPDYTAAKCREWREAHREESRAAARRWAKANPHKVKQYYDAYRARKLAATVVPFTAEQWEQKKVYWGNRCYLQISGLCTGGADTMDHVKPLATESTSAHMLANLRPACQRCNSSKGNTWPWLLAVAA